MVTIALATEAARPDLDEDGPAILAALAARGATARPAAWTDGSVDWDAFDLVVIRTTWDYTADLERFLAWTKRVPRLANPAPAIAWNTTKTYLRELSEAGVATVPTTWLSPGAPLSLPEGEVVIKPAVSAGARDTGRYAPGESARARAHVEALHAAGRLVMVQPYLDRIDERGETALFFFGGAFSHAIRKEPVLTRERVVAQFPAEAFVSARTPSAAERALADRVLALAPGPLAYARVDLVPDADGLPVLIELEITEPRLFLATSEGAAERYADALVAAARATGRG